MEQNMNNVNGQAGNVEEKLSNMGSEKKDEILSSFDGFKEYLSGKVSWDRKWAWMRNSLRTQHKR